MNVQDTSLKIVGPKDHFPEVTLIPPVQSGYLMLALEVDQRPPVGFFHSEQTQDTADRAVQSLGERLAQQTRCP